MDKDKQRLARQLIDLLRYSDIGKALIRKAAENEVILGIGDPDDREEDTIGGFITETDEGAYIELYEDADFGYLAHELGHNNHLATIHGNHLLYFRDKLAIMLLHEAEAYAIQALVILEVSRNLPDDHPGQKQVRRAKSYFGDFLDQYDDQELTEEIKGKIALKVFGRFLINPEMSKNYFHRYATAPSNASLIGTGAGLWIGAEGVANDLKMQMFLAFTGAAVGVACLFKQARQYEGQSSLKEIVQQTEFGNIPTIKQNYLSSINWNPEFEERFKAQINKTIDGLIAPWRARTFDGLNRVRRTTSKLFQGPKTEP